MTYKGCTYDVIEEFYGGFAIVKHNGKYNFIDSDGKLISETWFFNARNFNVFPSITDDISVAYYSLVSLTDNDSYILDTVGNIICYNKLNYKHNTIHKYYELINF